MDTVSQPLLLANAYLAWTAAVYLFQLNNSTLLDRAPVSAQLEAHRALLKELLTVGSTLETKLKTVEGEDLSEFLTVIKTHMTELEATNLFWNEAYGET